MSCKYYYFRQNDYYCMKKNDYVDSDTYYRYCRNYDYDDCPIYKDEDNGGCFLTSACIGVLGCPDNCEELSLLRNFRDTYMMENPKLRDEVSEYYKLAPKIVEKINSQKNFYTIYKSIYDNMILPCIESIKSSKFNETYNIYKREYLKLKEMYLK